MYRKYFHISHCRSRGLSFFFLIRVDSHLCLAARCQQTTAHTLCFVFGLLAIEQEEQEKVYQEVASLFSKDETPVQDLVSSSLIDSDIYILDLWPDELFHLYYGRAVRDPTTLPTGTFHIVPQHPIVATDCTVQ